MNFMLINLMLMYWVDYLIIFRDLLLSSFSFLAYAYCSCFPRLSAILFLMQLCFANGSCLPLLSLDSCRGLIDAFSCVPLNLEPSGLVETHLASVHVNSSFHRVPKCYHRRNNCPSCWQQILIVLNQS